ncbi:phosphoglycerate dehydrogenase [Pseudomonadales bacterium]|nr:phosphoglycerate dehydrogenase [Pseudomonadales bacterium]
MNKTAKVAVCSRSFSTNSLLRDELLSRYCNVKFNDTGTKMEGDELIEFLKGSNMAITALETIDSYVLSALPELEVIGKYGVGLDMIDLNAMKKYNKRLGWTPGVNRRSVSELTLALAIMLLRRVNEANQLVRKGGWSQLKGRLLSEKTFGIIGCGNVGKDLIQLLHPFGCKIVVNDVLNYPEFYNEYNIQPIALDELLICSDVVSLHIPLIPTTINLMSAKKLSLMKPTSILINTARGGLVDETMLFEMLQEHRLGGAGFDVFSQEPPDNLRLLGLDNFIATPHIGGSSSEAILAMGLAAIEGLESSSFIDDL